MFNHLKVELPTITATTTDGVRLYETPEGNKYPSITTILSVRNKKGLMEWRKKVGNEVANYVAGKAARRGTHVHHMCEDYLNNKYFNYQDSPLKSGIRTIGRDTTKINSFKLIEIEKRLRCKFTI